MADDPRRAEQRTLKVAGLDQTAEILVDPWGIPHIYAGTVHDAFFVQGFNAARDRLWQLDLWRKRGLGRLSESFGPAYVAQDRACRLFLYRGSLEDEWAAYGADAKAWSTAWIEGYNAYVGLVRARRAPRPVEFELTGSEPATWTLEDLVRIRSHGLIRNAEYEMIRTRVIAAAGLDADRLRRKLEPEHTRTIPEGLDPDDLPPDVLADYFLGTKEVAFGAKAGTVDHWTSSEEASAHGSNNWVVAPHRTATGRAMLASDPHRVLGAPSIRYVCHLEAPGLSVIGAGELHLAGVTIGHNGKIAFGITIFPADQEDLYVYELNPANPRQYRYDGGWEDMRLVREQIAVKGQAPREVELCFTRHGPVLKIDEAAGRAFALRTVWSEPGTSSYFSASRYQTSSNWPEFKQALTHWGAASMNFVYADVGGNIGWATAGKLPRRDNWDGLMPVPGDGRYEWRGFLDPETELPSVYNPAKGWFQTANEMNLPEGYPAEANKVGFEWADPSRAIRIETVLAANDRVTLQDSADLQVDDYSLAALRAVALLKGLSSPDPEVARALALLEAWDGHVSEKSAAAAIAEVWLNKHLPQHTIAKAAPASGVVPVTPGATYAVTTYLESPDAMLGSDPGAARREVLLASLRSALDEIGGRLGPDMSAWRWGDLHHARFAPAAAAAADPALAERMTHGPLPLRGSATTPCAATYRMDDFAAITGASFRMVVDVGDWDNSLVINSPGQSGDPDSPHYGDLFPLWAKGEFVPMLYSRPAIENVARQVIRLDPD
ncbi:MAG TPA: penicillin acylase family protein [Caulobacteraceae bacterium]|nr:penicillin acylase family protein [Caulobacteraceae bacterium]